jgi:hypothetical protein
MISKKTTTADGTTARPTYGYPGCDQLAAPAEKPGRPPESILEPGHGITIHDETALAGLETGSITGPGKVTQGVY